MPLDDLAARIPTRHGLELPRVGLGTAALGNFLSPVPDDEATATISAAFAAGVRYFDTAPLYGHGLAEQRTGRALRAVPADEYVVSTKVGRLLREGAPKDATQYDQDGRPFYIDVPTAGPVWDFTGDGIRNSLAESLDRLGLPAVDILHLHDPDDHYLQASTTGYAALDELRRTGRVKAIGAGMNRTPVLTRLVQNCDLDLVLVAGRYTLLDQTAAADLLPACRSRGTVAVIGGVFNSGILIEPDDDARFDYLPATRSRLLEARAIKAVCDRFGVPLAAAALQFPLAHPQVASVLIGPRSEAELQQGLSLLSVDIPPELWWTLKSDGLLDEDLPIPDEGDQR